MILSGMLLPLDDGPAWMRELSQFNPLTHVVNAERDLFAGHLAVTSVAFGFLAVVITALLGLPASRPAPAENTDAPKEQ